MKKGMNVVAATPAASYVCVVVPGLKDLVVPSPSLLDPYHRYAVDMTMRCLGPGYFQLFIQSCTNAMRL